MFGLLDLGFQAQALSSLTPARISQPLPKGVVARKEVHWHRQSCQLRLGHAIEAVGMLVVVNLRESWAARIPKTKIPCASKQCCKPVTKPLDPSTKIVLKADLTRCRSCCLPAERAEAHSASVKRPAEWVSLRPWGLGFRVERLKLRRCLGNRV